MINRLKKISLSTSFILICVLFIADVVRTERRWTGWNDTGTIRSDVAGYYLYLPALFVHNDLKLEYLNKGKDGSYLKIEHEPSEIEGGNLLIKYTCGTAYFYLPAFLTAHAYAKISGRYEANGYSKPYQRHMQFIGVLYLLPGLLALLGVLKRYGSNTASLITVFLILFSTNLYYYLTYEAAFPHSINFSLVCLLLYYSHRIADVYKKRYLIAIVAIVSLLTLIRPVNLLLAFVPFMILNYEKINFPDYFRKTIRPLNLFLVLVTALLVFMPQFIYWKYVTGHWLFYSYKHEGFDFTNSHLFDGLFSIRKGLFVYTPILLLIFPALILLFKKTKRLSIFILLFFLIYSFVTFSWHSWFYGGSFGCRALIDIYPVLAIPLLMIIEKTISANLLVKIPVGLYIVFCLSLNLFQTMQFKSNTLHWSNMDWYSYKAVFGKLILTPEERQVLEKHWATNYP